MIPLSVSEISQVFRHDAPGEGRSQGEVRQGFAGQPEAEQDRLLQLLLLRRCPFARSI